MNILERKGLKNYNKSNYNKSNMEEKVLLDTKVMWYKKKLQAFAGKLTITESKLTFTQDRVKSGGGLLGSLLASSSKKTKGGILINERLENLKFKKGKNNG